MRSLPLRFFQRPSLVVAAELIGVMLLVDGAGGPIVETEAYARDDPASHSFRGRTPRNAVMFGPAGHAYVYRSYGLHWCLNVTCGEGNAVLIRALEPVASLGVMQARRGTHNPKLLCAGPGRLAQALGVTDEMNGKSLRAPPFSLAAGSRGAEVVHSTRIGITRGIELPWRFTLATSPFISRPVRHGTAEP